jgi:hypothetical protein
MKNRSKIVFARTFLAGLIAATFAVGRAGAAPLPSIPELYKNYRDFSHPLVTQPLTRERIIPVPAVPGDSWVRQGDSWVAPAPSGGKNPPPPPPAAPGGKLRVHSFYLNQDVSGQGTNRLFCALALPDAPGPFPTVLVFHGGGGHASEALAVALAAHFRHTAIIAIDYNGQYRPSKAPVTQWTTVTPAIFAGRENIAADPRHFFMYHNVCAARTVLDWAEQQAWSDRKHFGAVGISYGGWVALILAGVDARINLVYNNVSAGGTEGTASRSSLPLRYPAPFDRAAWLALGDPIAYAPFTKAAVFFSVCSNDHFFWLTGVARNRRALAGPSAWLVRPNSDHGGGGPDVIGPSGLWGDIVWHGAPPLPTLTPASSDPSDTFSWKVTPGAKVDHLWLCWSPGSTAKVDDCARYWVRVEAKARGGNLFSAAIPPEGKGYAALVYPLAEFSAGYALAGDLQTRPGVEPQDRPGKWAGQAVWDLARKDGAWRPLVGDPSSGTRIDAGEGDGVLVRPNPAGLFAALTDSVGLVSASARGTAGLRIVLDGKSTGGSLIVRLTRKTMSLDESAVEAPLDFKPGPAGYFIPWSAFKAVARKASFDPTASWWDGLTILGQGLPAGGVGIGPIRWAPAAAP